MLCSPLLHTLQCYLFASGLIFIGLLGSLSCSIVYCQSWRQQDTSVCCSVKWLCWWVSWKTSCTIEVLTLPFLFCVFVDYATTSHRCSLLLHMVCVSVFMLGTQADCESSCGLVWQASGSGTMGTGVHCTPQVQDLYRCTPQVKDAAYVKILSMRYEVRTNLYSPLMKKFRRACGRHTLVGPRNHILDAVGHRRHLVNITERSVCCGNAALCQITLTTGFLFLCHFLQALS